MRNMPPPSKKRKIAVTVPEKIEFDFSAREEYLTGFHKRKLARIKHAQEENAKKEKEEKLRFRREVSHPLSYNFLQVARQELAHLVARAHLAENSLTWKLTIHPHTAP
jgi:ribosomal RNA-processing protein 17